MNNLLTTYKEEWEDETIFADMSWAKPLYTREQVNQAGNVLLGRKPSNNLATEMAFAVIDNWRSSHNFPLNTFQSRLRRKAAEVDDNSIVVQRIKRLYSITKKLERFPDMKLSQIQDIGGCRAIMSDINNVETLVEIYKHKSAGTKHKIATEHDYIKCPKESGYRGVHLVYKYRSDRNQTYNDLKIEIQLRTLLQHSWATAVETVGTFARQSLKSNEGEKKWLRFFSLIASYMALKEGKELVPNTPTSNGELRDEIIKYERMTGAIKHLDNYRILSQALDDANADLPDAHYYILELDASKREINVNTFKHTEFKKANDTYMRLERNNFEENKDIVLVSAESLQALKAAYPNYYLDTDMFLNLVREITG